MDEQSQASFEQWAAEHGSADVSALDRRKVAADLIALGGDALDEAHIDTLAAQYKAGLQGAHRILAVRKVGGELIEWRKAVAANSGRQRSQTARSVAPPAAPATGAKSIRPGRVSVQWARAAEAAEPGPGEAAARRDSGRPESVVEPLERAARASSLPPVDRGRSPGSSQKIEALAAPGSRALAAPNVPSLEVESTEGVAPRLRRADLELGFAEHGIAVDPSDAFDDEIPVRPAGARSSTLPSEHPKRGLASVGPAVARGASERVPARVRGASPLPFIAPRASGTPRPFAAVDRAAQSERPPAVSPSMRPGHRSSFPPEVGSSDRPPSGSEPPEHTPSSRPQHGSSSRRPPSLSPSSSLRPSVRAPGVSSLFPPAPLPPDEQPSRRWLFAGLGVIVLLALAIGFGTGLFGRRAESAEPVLGTFPSEHLGLSFRPAGLWLHAADRDRRTKFDDGWERRSTWLYRGASADAFDAQLYVSVFAHPDRVATPDDARKLGGAELTEAVGPRECGEYPAGALSVYGCSATLRGPKGLVPCFEGYVQWGARVLFVRHAGESTGADGPGPEAEALAVFSTIAPFR